MGGELPRDASNIPMQSFAPCRVESVTSGVAWTPDTDDRAFAVTEYVSYSIDGGTSVPLVEGSIRGIVPGQTYTFSADTDIEVM